MPRRPIPALVLICLGTLFLLDNLGLADLDARHLVATWWPALLILAGIGQLTRRFEGKSAGA